MNQVLTRSPVYSIVMIAYFIVMFIIGILAKGKTNTAEDFWVAGRKLGVGVLMGTFTATFISSFTMIGLAGSSYSTGWTQWSTSIGTWGGPLIMILTMKYFVKFMGLTVPDILEARYGGVARPVSAFMTAVGLVAYTGVQMYAMGTIMTLVLGWPTKISMIVSSIIMILYTMAGGFLAVAWTDCVQAVMLVAGLFATVIVVLREVGGVTELNQALVNINPNYVAPYGANQTPMALIATIIAFGLGNPSQPAYLSRAFAAKNVKSIQIAVAGGSLFNVWGMLCGIIIGMAARVIFGPNISPIDAVFPHVVIQLLPPFIGALLIAAIIAAIMSTADSYLLSFGTTIAHDFYHNYIRPQASDEELLKVSRYSLGIAGLISLLVSLWFPGTVLTIGAYVFGGMAAALFIPTYIGFFWRRANTAGAVASMIFGAVGLVLFTKVNIGMHPIIMGVLCSAVSYVFFSLVTPPMPEEHVEAFMKRIGRGKDSVRI